MSGLRFPTVVVAIAVKPESQYAAANADEVAIWIRYSFARSPPFGSLYTAENRGVVVAMSVGFVWPSVSKSVGSVGALSVSTIENVDVTLLHAPSLFSASHS